LLPSKTPRVPGRIHRPERKSALNKIKQQTQTDLHSTHITNTRCRRLPRNLPNAMKRAPLLDPLPARPSRGEGTSTAGVLWPALRTLSF
jgi:hypothetical protein